MKVAILRTKNRNDSISIGALVIQDELTREGIAVAYCDYQTAHNFTHVLVSMTSTLDVFDIYANCRAANWQTRRFTAFVGGFGCQNPMALAPYFDFAFFGRVDGIISDYLRHPEKYSQHSFHFSNPHPVQLRQVTQCYPHTVIYGKNSVRWKEKIIGCPFRCKFCHYSHSRKYVGDGSFMNDQISASAEVMLKDIPAMDHKPGRITTALDGYSERLRFLYGKRITWDMVEEAMDFLASFKGNTFLKLYNITNFPTETDTDCEEFHQFWKQYTTSTIKADGRVVVDVYNTAFRPSLNTPMERCEATLFPEARCLPNKTYIAEQNGFAIKFTHNTKGAWSHLEDLISIRYTDPSVIEYIATNQQFSKLNNKEKLEQFNKMFDISPYIRSYTETEQLNYKVFTT